jgi:hypothetical protein
VKYAQWEVSKRKEVNLEVVWDSLFFWAT